MKIELLKNRKGNKSNLRIKKLKTRLENIKKLRLEQNGGLEVWER
ncbi:hypothetical protein LCGC14_0490410 [marine sediment metagenome]|uniref:Uncharacterized protein n=1 Tax=marine sediment metagenome TaxID=412755 RepID=A0A0F9S6Q9_9ZZZZ|nr:MAG: hypothetical protein Lokiarch_17250 [Candidatus Lokiarchaeum sp. GC14_75]